MEWVPSFSITTTYGNTTAQERKTLEEGVEAPPSDSWATAAPWSDPWHMHDMDMFKFLQPGSRIRRLDCRCCRWLWRREHHTSHHWREKGLAGAWGLKVHQQALYNLQFCEGFIFTSLLTVDMCVFYVSVWGACIQRQFLFFTVTCGRMSLCVFVIEAVVQCVTTGI